MRIKTKLVLTLKLAAFIAFLYFFSYLMLSWMGKADSYSYDGLEWSFRGTKGGGAYYFPWSSSFKPEILESERKMCLFYRPLIQLDARLTKDKHIYHKIAPECGK